jgi:hypothetical protein
MNQHTPRHFSKLTAIRRVELHRLKSILLLQRGARPFPKASHVALTGELAAVLSDWHGVPMFEPHVRPGEVHEEIVWVWTSCRSAGGPVERWLGWWRFLHAVVHEMSRCMLADRVPTQYDRSS